MQIDETLSAWLRLAHVPGVGVQKYRRLLKEFLDPATVFSADMGRLCRLVGEKTAAAIKRHDSHDAVSRALDWANQDNHHILTLSDEAYPPHLLFANNPPLLLYVVGNPKRLHKKTIAIVGSRTPSKQGEANATSFARELCKQGFAIVSGLARGIDAAAHQGALQAQGTTIAVMGTGMDIVYPAANRELARQIAAEGVLCSEFHLGTQPTASHFPQRNRIIAALGQACLVVEAARHSGSLITARYSAEIGKDVFAIPGSIHSTLSKGCHALIRQGAKLVESTQDILEELETAAPQVVSEAKAPCATDSAILIALGTDPCDMDTLSARTQEPVESLLAQLLTLELEGKIEKLAGGRYQRVIP